ncbi:TetR family transcriptional regulator [Haloarcula quadrata]|uniref:DNA binding protein n=5 Tax=Haloarcula TaxID=2237 RepID=Q5V7L7_HALMA|nr:MULTISPECIES: TetR/AcrR family transcriptional regulator [Haloarcula]AAV44486.1 DNA binding protein [Haloarcula marismortui ATCC 43049]EMA06982.1 DNA binding protein [Haloarcula sinaiiensis ATCC 33800]NHN66041.1 TetR/AcrR family transcriptional regulator [Haloarcula sp. JP-Z28]QCP89661.1 TetR/AcrR family transcriptional regulator [Haloarcula marismortui ATCC 43049]QUJ74821.1 TetR/AcrR family transcriptional regulator [Haloarcula sinaiiensis ATCC 33800]
MTNEISFFQNPEGTQEEILEATFYALRQHGYADLTISKIGDEFEKSQSLIYHHYDNKDELLVDLLDYMLEQVESQVPLPNQSPEEYIEIIVDEMFGTNGNNNLEFTQAIIELRAQAAHDDNYGRLFRRSDDFIRKQIARAIRAGVDAGAFDVENPSQTAALFHTVLIGIQTEQITSDEEPIDYTRAEFQRYIENCLFPE